MARLRSEDLEFVSRAPLRLVFAREVAATPAALFGALAGEPDSWPRWFPSVASCSYRGEGPYGVGTTRLVRIRVTGPSFEETVLAWDEDRRFVYRVDKVTSPGLRALMEEWLLTPADDGGTRVQWTFAADASAPVRLFLRAMRPGLGRSFQGAVRNLDRRLTALA